MMKHNSLTSTLVRVSSCFVIMTAVALTAAQPVRAEDKAAAAIPAATKIAVVDLQMLVSESKAGKSIRSQLEAQRNTYRGQIEKQEAELSTMEKDLVAQQAKVSKEEFMKKRKAFQDKVVAAQRSVQERRGAFDRAYTKAMETLREHVVKIVAQFATKQKIGLVLDRQQVVLVEADMDLSKDVLKALDAKVTSIPVTVK